MENEAQRQDTRKAMAYDLIKILEANPEKKSYTTEELTEIIHTYVNSEN